MVQGTTRKVLMANAMDATLANNGVFMQWHAHNAKVALVRYRRANGIPSPYGNDTHSPYFILILIKLFFGFQDLMLAIYL